MNGMPVRVGVLVDLALAEEAGGHVKCWERFAEAATELPADLDLTVHFMGPEVERRELSPNVRYVLLPPVFSTARLPFLGHSPDHTDLAPVHPALRRHLGDYDVVHATDAYFAYARTALKWTRRHRRPLVSSTHTDTPKYTRLFARDALLRLGGGGAVGRLLADRLGLPERLGRSMSRKLDRYLAASDHVLASSAADRERALRLLPPERVGTLRRGIDKCAFRPDRRDRAAVEARYGIPPGRHLLLYVGRVDASKSPLVLADAARLLIDRGVPVHVLYAGRGGEHDAVAARLGPHATLTGPLPQGDLPALYASADLFVFPSRTELSPNVAVEAKASGLPVVLSSHGGSRQMVVEDGRDGRLIESGDPLDWAEAVGALLADPNRLRTMAAAAREHVERGWPSWRDVLAEDLLPVWRRVAAAYASGRA